MDLIINQMMQFQIVHVTNCYRTVEILSCTAVTQTHFTVSGDWNTLPQCSVGFVLIQILHYIRC